ncbi:hypothetical protein GCM10010428_20480 [Actinosynnema pretiosum subsp. pretiosum]
MISSTRSRVVAATSARPFITFETVGTDTPASAAMSAIVTLPEAVLPEDDDSALVGMAAVYGRSRVVSPVHRDVGGGRRARSKKSAGPQKLSAPVGAVACPKHSAAKDPRVVASRCQAGLSGG